MVFTATPAILLRTIDFGESDRVVTLFGRTTGCLGAIARGARKSQRRFGGGLGLFSVGEAALRERGGSELLSLERFDLTASFPRLGSDLSCMGEAAYVAELLAKLCAPRQAEPEIFDLAVELLGLLEGEGSSAVRLRVFELALLRHLGFGPTLDHCATCRRSDLSTGIDIDVRFIPERGGIVCQRCESRGRAMRPSVRVALCRMAGTPLAAAGQIQLPLDVAGGCRDALRELFAIHLSAPLRSLEWIAKLERSPPPPSAPAPPPRGTGEPGK